MRSPTVSVPVDVYVLVLVPSLTVNAELAGMPSVMSAVFVLTGTMPVPIAADPVVEVGDDAEEPCTVCKALCSAAVSWAWVRDSALLLAMLAMPFVSAVIASPIEVISAELAD